MIPGTGSGTGPQSGGWMVTDSDRANAARNDLHSKAMMERLLQESRQWENARRVMAPLIGGQSTDAQNEFLYGTRPGALAQLGLGAMATRGLAGGGNPMELAYGMQQFLSRSGGGYIDKTLAGGSNFRGLTGAGFMTDKTTEGLWKGVQESLFGKNGNMNRVSGLNDTQVGRLISALGPTALHGRTQTTVRDAGPEEIIARAKNEANPLVRKQMEGVTKDNIDDRIKEAEKKGNTQLSDALKRTKSATTLVDIDKGFEKDFTDLVKASASLTSTLGDVLGSDDMVDMLHTAKAITGKVIKTARDAREAKVMVDQSIAFAKSQGIDPKSYITDVITQSTAANQYLQQNLGVNNPVLAAAFGRVSSRHGAVVGSTEGLAAGFNAQEASAMQTVGMAERLRETPELVTALSKLEYGNLSGEQRKELQGLANSFKTAASPEEMDATRANLDTFFRKTYGKGWFETIGREKGLKAAMEDRLITGKLTDYLAPNVSASATRAGSENAFERLELKSREALGPGGARLGEILDASINEKSRAELVKTMESGDEGAVRALLEKKAGNLQDAFGKKVGVEDLLGQLKGTGGLKASAGAVKSLTRTMKSIQEGRASMSNEDQADTNAKELAQDMNTNGAWLDEQRTTGKSIEELFAEGFVTGADGRLNPAAVIAMAVEEAKTDPTKKVGILKYHKGRLRASGATLEKLLAGKAGSDELMAASGARNYDELSGLLKADEKGELSGKLNAFLKANYAGGFTSREKGTLAFFERDEYERIEEANQFKGRAGFMAQIAGLDKKGVEALKGKKNEKEYAWSLLGQLETNTDKESLLQKAKAGDEGALSTLSKLDKASAGEFKIALDQRINDLQQESVNMKKDEKTRKASDAEALSLQTVSDKLKVSGADDVKVMTVGVIQLMNPIQSPPTYAQ